MPRVSRLKLPPIKPGGESIGERVARLRRERGFTQVELAEKVGIIQTIVSAIETNVLKLSAEMAVRFAMALEVSTDDLLQPSGPKPARKASRKVIRRLEQIEKPLSVPDSHLEGSALEKPTPSRTSRWLILAVIGIACYGGYYAFDYIGPLAPLLASQLHFSNSDIGLLQAAYSLPNIVAMLICGAVIDRLGTRKSLSIFAALIFAGLVFTAISPRLDIMAAGRLLVGVGGEALALTANVGVARWFWHDELSLGFGLRALAARLGSLSAQTSPTWAATAYAHWRWPLLIGIGVGGFCLLGAALYWILDARGARRFRLAHTGGVRKIRLRDALRFNRSFWLIAALCVTFYGCIFPFETFAQKFLIEARHVSPQTASLLVGMEPLFSLIGMPIFGILADRYAHRSLLMMVGSLFIVPVFPMLSYTSIPPVIPMAMMGVAFALVPAIMWPALVYVVEESNLGLANGMLDTVQQLGLVIVNLSIGWANDHWLASATNAAGYHAGMLMFTGIALLSVLCAFGLWRAETGPHAHRLETITTKKLKHHENR